jgi:hypothetical protein
LPGFADFQFTCSADADALGEAVRQSYQKMVERSEAGESELRCQNSSRSRRAFQETFQRLRRERNDTPIVLAE